MTKGDLWKHQFDVTPCEEGSFLVRVEIGFAGDGPVKTYAFSNVSDLLRWFQFHVTTQSQQQELKNRLLNKQQDSKQLPASGAIPLPDLTKPVVKRAYWPIKLS